MPGWQDRYRGSGAGVLPDEAALAGAALAGAALAGPNSARRPAGGSPAATPARPYGRILIFTLLDDRVADFDRLAEQTAEEIRLGEPDTLVYVIHLVPNAPMQRIFYEIYRDRAAFESTRASPICSASWPSADRTCSRPTSSSCGLNTPRSRRCPARRRPLGPVCQLGPIGTGPGGRTQLPPGPPPRTQPSPVGSATGPRGIPGTSGPQGTQRLQPLPPRPSRRAPDQPRPDQPVLTSRRRPDQRWADAQGPGQPAQQRPDQQRPDQRWADPRQVPSADRHYRG